MKKNIHRLLCSALLFPVFAGLCSCGGTKESATTDNADPAETAETPASGEIVVAEKGGETDFRLVYNVDCDDSVRYNILQIREAFADQLGVTLKPLDDFSPKEETPYEIIVGSAKRAECAALTETLGKDEYAIRAMVGEGGVKIILAYNGSFARLCVIDRFLKEYVTGERCAVPADLDVRGVCGEADALITSKILRLRDPCILVEDDGTYYAYGTGWKYFRNTTGSLSGSWEGPFSCVNLPLEVDGCQWAPEVHRYKGAYYMITTYSSSKTNHRGCTVMKADSPEGPFEEISDGQITPHDWDSIDGTLYIDPDGQPWMVFVHEWTSTSDRIGRMAAAKLSDDLSHFTSEPIELFTARDPKWATNNVTDGCWMYTTSGGELLMIWSNWDNQGYCVGISRSSNGRLDGTWTHDAARLYSKGQTNTYDGGHGIIFRDVDGQLYLSLHSPNAVSDGRPETPVFIPIRESGSTLVWDVYR